MVRTRVGYAGGTTQDPTYRSIGDHSETIQIEYDPTQVSYADLLGVFWESHNPTSRPFSRQYMSIIFYHNEEQKRLALETKEREAGARGTIYTEIVPASQFYLAEDYHQKYRLRQARDLMREFKAIYPREEDFVNSTAAARVNGYLGGHGTSAVLAAELDDLGLSPAGGERLLDIVRASGR